MNFLKAAFIHWKTSTAGIAGALLIVMNSYKTGMTWKAWGLAAAFALLGIGAHDATTATAPKP